jgi:prohibitin 2
LKRKVHLRKETAQFFCVKMNLNNMRNVKLPQASGPAGALARLAVIGGVGLYAAVNSLYNVEGGHRAIVFNRLVGVKDKVCC